MAARANRDRDDTLPEIPSMIVSRRSRASTPSAASDISTNTAKRVGRPRAPPVPPNKVRDEGPRAPPVEPNSVPSIMNSARFVRGVFLNKRMQEFLTTTIISALELFMTTIMSAFMIGLAWFVFYSIFRMSVLPINLPQKLEHAKHLEAQDAANIFCQWSLDAGNRKTLKYMSKRAVGLKSMQPALNSSGCFNMEQHRKNMCKARRDAWEQVVSASIEHERLYQQVMFHFYGAAPPSGYFAAIAMYLVFIYFANAFNIIFKRRDNQKPLMRVLIGSCYLSISDIADANVIFVILGVILALWGFMGPTIIPVFQLFTQLCELALGGIVNLWHYMCGNNTTYTTQWSKDWNTHLNAYMLEARRESNNISDTIKLEIKQSTILKSLPAVQHDVLPKFSHNDSKAVCIIEVVQEDNGNTEEEEEQSSQANAEEDQGSDNTRSQYTLGDLWNDAKWVYQMANTPWGKLARDAGWI